MITNESNGLVHIMSEYLELFFQSTDQLRVLFSVFVIWFMLTAIGAWVSGKERFVPADIISGWAVIVVLFTLGGVFTKLSFSWLTMFAAIIAMFAIIFVSRREGFWISSGWFKLVVLGTPLLVLAAAMQGSQWDEFSDWLAIPRYLLSSDFLPSSENTYASANAIAYPFGWHYITYLVSRLGGRFFESVGPLVNILLLLTFAWALLNILKAQFAAKTSVYNYSWWMIAVAGLAVTLINPTFVQKVVLTSYADTSTSVVSGFCLILFWHLLGCLSNGNRKEAKSYSLQLSLALILLVSLKQANFALFGIFIISFLICVLRDNSINFKIAVRYLGVIVLPALIIYLSWRFHILSNLSRGELTFLPLEKWHLIHIPAILAQMIITLAKKGYYLGLVIITVGLAVKSFYRCQNSFDRLILMSGLLIVGYNAFLFLIYLSSFSEFDALRVASYWRYNMHLGAIIILSSSFILVNFITRNNTSFRFFSKLAWLPIILVLIAPFVLAKKLRFDHAPMLNYYRTIGAEVKGLMPKTASYFVLDPKGSGEAYDITRYKMNEIGKPRGYLAAYHKIDKKALDSIFINENNRPSYVLIYSLNHDIWEYFRLGDISNRPGKKWAGLQKSFLIKMLPTKQKVKDQTTGQINTFELVSGWSYPSIK